jgi:hypothetical protein
MLTLLFTLRETLVYQYMFERRKYLLKNHREIRAAKHLVTLRRNIIFFDVTFPTAVFFPNAINDAFLHAFNDLLGLLYDVLILVDHP